MQNRIPRSVLGAAWFLALLGTITTALYKLGDSFVSQNIITPNGTSASFLTAASAYLTLGGFIGVVVMTVILGAFPNFARRVDPKYAKLSMGSWRLQGFALVGGIFAAAATAATLYSLQLYDGGLVLALSACGIIYVTLHDVLKGEVKWKTILIPVALVTIGAIFTSGAEPGKFTVGAFVLVFCLRNLFFAGDEHYKQRGVAAMKDMTLVFNYWRFVYLFLTGAALALVAVSWQGQFDLYVLLITRNLVWAVIAITGVMILVFLSDGWINQARTTLSASETNVITNLAVGIGVFLTWIITLIRPGTLGSFPTEPLPVVLRFVGVGFIIAGVYVLNERERRIKDAKAKLAAQAKVS